MANYHFIAGDGKQYGPYSAEQMRQYMGQNRLTGKSQVSADGGPWQPAGSYPELTVGDTSAPASGSVTQQNRPVASALDAIIPTNPLAAFSCYIGIFSILCCGGGVLLGPIAIVLGILGLKKWKAQESSYGATTSKIRIWVGIITGSIGFIVGVIFIILLVLDKL